MSNSGLWKFTLYASISYSKINLANIVTWVRYSLKAGLRIEIEPHCIICCKEEFLRTMRRSWLVWGKSWLKTWVKVSTHLWTISSSWSSFHIFKKNLNSVWCKLYNKLSAANRCVTLWACTAIYTILDWMFEAVKAYLFICALNSSCFLLGHCSQLNSWTVNNLHFTWQHIYINWLIRKA